MNDTLPDYYFRVRENAAFVFRLDTENRQRRIEMDQIAVVNMRNGEIKAQGDRKLSDADIAAIKEWMEERAKTLAYREIDVFSAPWTISTPLPIGCSLKPLKRSLRR